MTLGISAVAIGLLGPACSERTPLPAQPTPAHGESAAPAEPLAVVAHAEGPRVCFSDVGQEALSTGACVTTPAPVASMVWRDRTDLVVLLEGRRTGIVSGRAFAELQMPEENVWRVPRPGRTDVPMAEGTSAKLLVSEHKEIWLGRCAWVTLVDEPACQAWVFARLGGSPAVRRDEPSRGAVYGPASSPSDVRVTIENAVQPGQSTRVRCERGEEQGTFAAPAREGATSSAEIAWLTSGPTPLFLVIVAHDYLETIHSEVFLMRACDPVPRAVLGARAGERGGLVFGPRGVFAHRGEDGWVIRVGERKVATLPPSEAAPVFRP